MNGKSAAFGDVTTLTDAYGRFDGLLSYPGGPQYHSRYSDSLRAGPSGVRTPVGGEIFRTRPDGP